MISTLPLFFFINYHFEIAKYSSMTQQSEIKDIKSHQKPFIYDGERAKSKPIIVLENLLITFSPNGRIRFYELIIRAIQCILDDYSLNVPFRKISTHETLHRPSSHSLEFNGVHSLQWT